MSEPLRRVTPEERAEIRARLDAATPGPWRVSPSPSGTRWIDAGTYDEVISPASVDCMRYCYGGTSDINLSVADADLIAHAPDDLRRLLDALDAAEQRIADLTRSQAAPPFGRTYTSVSPTTVLGGRSRNPLDGQP